MDKCTCSFCKTYAKYKWAVVLNCGCGCHTSDGMAGHDNLCCEFPNGLFKNSPYKAEELNLTELRNELNKMQDEE